MGKQKKIVTTLHQSTKRNYIDSAIAIYQAMLPDLPWAHSISDILNYMDPHSLLLAYIIELLKKLKDLS